jgi:hypothetical protein
VFQSAAETHQAAPCLALLISVGKKGRPGNRLETGWKPAGNRLETGWKPAGNRLETGWNPAGNRLESGRRQTRSHRSQAGRAVMATDGAGGRRGMQAGVADRADVRRGKRKAAKTEATDEAAGFSEKLVVDNPCSAKNALSGLPCSAHSYTVCEITGLDYCYAHALSNKRRLLRERTQRTLALAEAEGYLLKRVMSGKRTFPEHVVKTIIEMARTA